MSLPASRSYVLSNIIKRHISESALNRGKTFLTAI